MTTQTSEPTRRVRPWIAALLTFVGWGVGFYYARQTRRAWRWAWLSVIIGAVVALAGMTALFLRPALYEHPLAQWAPLLSLLVTLIVAIIAWRATAREQHVARAGPGRLAGYLAIWLIPMLISMSFGFGMRVATIQPFRQPSGSMQPTLHVGQHFFVTKWSYGYSRFSAAPLHDLLPPGRTSSRLPERGDVVVFRPPPEPNRDFVKRIVGLPGDRIQMIDGALHINGEAVRTEALGEIMIDGTGRQGPAQGIRETLPNGASYVVANRGTFEFDNTREFTVPPGHYFMMGDDRDNSADSRVPGVVGFVPIDNIIGRVHFAPRE